ALDLFLGTHGWRRFVNPTPGAVVCDASRSILFPEGETSIFHYDNRGQAEDHLATAIKVEQARLAARVQARLDSLPTEGPGHEQEAASVARAVDRAVAAVALAARDLANYQEQPRLWLPVAAGVAVVVLCLLGGLSLAIALARGTRGNTAYLGTASASLLVCMV